MFTSSDRYVFAVSRLPNRVENEMRSVSRPDAIPDPLSSSAACRSTAELYNSP